MFIRQIEIFVSDYHFGPVLNFQDLRKSPKINNNILDNKMLDKNQQQSNEYEFLIRTLSIVFVTGKLGYWESSGAFLSKFGGTFPFSLPDLSKPARTSQNLGKTKN